MIEVVGIRIKNDFLQVEFSTGEKLVVPPDLAKIYGLAQGKSIDPSRFATLKEEAERFRCRRKALDRIAARARSVKEMETYLLGKGFARACVQEITASLKNQGLLDDFQFALQFIRARRERRAVGRNLLAAELARRGVDRATAVRALGESGADEGDPAEIYECARKKLTQLAGKKNVRVRLAQFLGRRGFDGRQVHGVLNRLKKEGFDFDDGAEESHDEGE
jgi:regulatory protein